RSAACRDTTRSPVRLARCWRTQPDSNSNYTQNDGHCNQIDGSGAERVPGAAREEERTESLLPHHGEPAGGAEEFRAVVRRHYGARPGGASNQGIDLPGCLLRQRMSLLLGGSRSIE